MAFFLFKNDTKIFHSGKLCTEDRVETLETCTNHSFLIERKEKEKKIVFARPSKCASMRPCFECDIVHIKIMAKENEPRNREKREKE